MTSSLVAFLVLSLTAGAGGKEEYEKAVKFSQAGEYEAALPLFQKAYTLSGKRPSTILALAQCERALKRYDEAITHFKEYRNTKPTPKDAKKVDDTIQLLEEIIAQQKEAEQQKKLAAAQPPPSPPPKVEPPPPATAQPQAQPPPKQQIELAPPIARATTEPVHEDDSILDSPVFWAISAGVVAVGGGVAIALALGGAADPYGGTSGVVLHK